MRSRAGMPAACGWLLASMAAAATAADATPAALKPVATAAAKPAAAPAATAAADTAPTALGQLGLALLREAPGPNAVVSPLAVATVLGLVQSGANGTTEREIEALFGSDGTRVMRQSLPALSAQLRRGEAGGKPALTQAARAWIDTAVAKDVPASYQRRIAQRHGADAQRLAFADTEAARTQINRWTAEHTAGRVAELLPPGSLGERTQLTLTAAVHFRAAWEKPFDAAATEPRPFTTSAGAAAPVPTMHDERAVARATVDGTQLYGLPFAAGYDLVLALPAAGSDVDALLKAAEGGTFGRWHAALNATLKAPAPPRCAFSLPKFTFAPKAGSIRPLLEKLGVKTAFTERAELRPMLGRAAAGSHVDDVLQAAGIAIDEAGGEAVAAAAATVKPKTLSAPPACAVDRAFAFALMHRASGAPVFIGRVGDPARAE